VLGVGERAEVRLQAAATRGTALCVVRDGI
jgi:hypothetical protein